MIIQAVLIANVFIFSAKIVVELSIGVNKTTNLIEAVNLTFQLFAYFIGVTLKSLTLIKSYTLFDPQSQGTFISFQMIAELVLFQRLFMGISAFFYPFRVFQFLAQFKFFNQVRIFINILYRMTPGILVYTVFVSMLLAGWA